MDRRLANAIEPHSVHDLVQDLIYELRVAEVMTRDVITVSPETSMKVAREAMRTHRISGLPVVNADQKLVGLISVEDVIKWLAESGRETEVGEKMSTDVITVRVEERVAEAIKRFARYGYRRLPVVNSANRVVGIVTGGDITGRLLVVLSRDQHREEPKPAGPTLLEDVLHGDEALLALRYNIIKGDFDKAGEASSRIKRVLLRLGLDQRLARRVAICAYEAEMNVVIHSYGGLLLAEIHPTHVALFVGDEGPGIPDVAKAMEPGYSTAPDWVRDLGFGAGMGLTNIERNADWFEINSAVGKGTSVTALINLRNHR